MPEEDEPSKWYGVAGTVFDSLYGGGGVGSATVRVTDAEGTVVELSTSSAGNFYSTTELVPPLDAEVERDGVVSAMTTAVNTGACNSCHRCDGPPAGKLY